MLFIAVEIFVLAYYHNLKQHRYYHNLGFHPALNCIGSLQNHDSGKDHKERNSKSKLHFADIGGSVTNWWSILLLQDYLPCGDHLLLIVISLS